MDATQNSIMILHYNTELWKNENFLVDLLILSFLELVRWLPLTEGRSMKP